MKSKSKSLMLDRAMAGSNTKSLEPPQREFSLVKVTGSHIRSLVIEIEKSVEQRCSDLPKVATRVSGREVLTKKTK